MRKFILKYSISIGLIIYGIFQLVNHLVTINDYVAIPVCLVSIVFMMIGLFNQGRRLGRRINSDK